MNDQHTQGRLVVTHFSGAAYDLRGDGGADVGNFIKYEDARRLAACWNACEGLTVENLEDNMPLLDGLAGLNTKLAESGAALFAARALLIEVIAEVPDDYSDELAERIRAHLKGQP